MNVLFQFFEFETGKLTIDGHDIKEMPKKQLVNIWELYCKIRFYFSGTVATNVSLEN